jgi:hypothetical protein
MLKLVTPTYDIERIDLIIHITFYSFYVVFIPRQQCNYWTLKTNSR